MLLRRFALGAVAVCAAAALSGSASAEDIQRGGTLRMALSIGPGSLDPLWGDAPTSDRYSYNLLFESLVVVETDGLKPSLAKSWKISDDKKTITFKLHEGVTFHDGTPFDAEAVKFNYLRFQTSPEAMNAADMKLIQSVDVVDAHTVKVNLAETSGAIMSTLASESGMIVSPTALKKLGNDFKRNPVGTGPFQFDNWKNDVLSVKRFDGYWRKGADGKPLPYLDGVTIRVIPKTAVKIVEAQSGNVDLTDSVQVREFAKIERDPNLALLDNPQTINQWVCFNTAQPPFDNADLRKAVSYGLNRDAMAKVIAGKYGLVTGTLVPPSWWIYDPALKGYGYDPEKAKEHLKKSGFTGEFTLAVIKRDPDTQIAQILQSQLKIIGLKANIQVLERQAWIELVLKKKSHEMAMLRINVPRLDPDHLFGKTFGRNAGANWSQISDEKLFDVIDAGMTSFEAADRKPFYVDAQKILLDNAYYAFLFHRPLRDIASKKLHGVKAEPFGPFILTETWIAQ